SQSFHLLAKHRGSLRILRDPATFSKQADNDAVFRSNAHEFLEALNFLVIRRTQLAAANGDRDHFSRLRQFAAGGELLVVFLTWIGIDGERHGRQPLGVAAAGDSAL